MRNSDERISIATISYSSVLGAAQNGRVQRTESICYTTFFDSFVGCWTVAGILYDCYANFEVFLSYFSNFLAIINHFWLIVFLAALNKTSKDSILFRFNIPAEYSFNVIKDFSIRNLTKNQSVLTLFFAVYRLLFNLRLVLLSLLWLA